MAGLLDGLHDGLNIERLDGAEVDDFGFDAVFGLELFGGGKGLADAAGECYDGEVLAGALDLGFAELCTVRERGGMGGKGRDGKERGSYRNNKVVLLGCFAHGEGETVQKPVHISRSS